MLWLVGKKSLEDSEKWACWSEYTIRQKTTKTVLHRGVWRIKHLLKQ